MPTGIGTALLISGLAGAGASAIGGKVASNAAKGAAKTQQAAADKSAALMQQAYAQQQALQQPYLQLGRSAAGNLGALMTPGQAYTPAMQAQNAQFSATPPPMGVPPPGPQMGPNGMFAPPPPARPPMAAPNPFLQAFARPRY